VELRSKATGSLDDQMDENDGLTMTCRQRWTARRIQSVVENVGATFTPSSVVETVGRRDFPFRSTLLLQFRPLFSFGKSEDKSVQPERRNLEKKVGENNEGNLCYENFYRL
jgi:hypothetical protein